MVMPRRFLSSLIVLAILCSGIGPVSRVSGAQGTFESLTVGATAVGLQVATYTPRAGSRKDVRCIMRLETAQIRFLYNGTNPTAAEGTLLEVGDVFTLTGFEYLEDFRAIRTGATSGVLKVSCDS